MSSSFDAAEFYGFVLNKYPNSAKVVFEAILQFKQQLKPIEENRSVVSVNRPNEKVSLLNSFYKFLIEKCQKKQSTARTYKTTIGKFLKQHELIDKNPQEIKNFLETFEETKPDGIKTFIKYLDTRIIEQPEVMN